MPEIIHLKFKRGRPERFIVSLEDETELILSPDTVVKYGISPGKRFLEDEFLKILQEDSTLRAKDQILKYLGIRAHSRYELMIKCRRKGYLPEVVETALSALEKVGLVDDADFARTYIRNEMLLKPCGRRLMTEKLRKRGVTAEIFEPLLDDAFRQYPPEQIALDLARMFIARQGHLEKSKRSERLIRHLQAKGFPWDIIRHIIFEEGLAADDDDDFS